LNQNLFLKSGKKEKVMHQTNYKVGDKVFIKKCALCFLPIPITIQSSCTILSIDEEARIVEISITERPEFSCFADMSMINSS